MKQAELQMLHAVKLFCFLKKKFCLMKFATGGEIKNTNTKM